MSEEYGNNILSLIDEDGIEKEFEMLAAVEYNGSEYVALSEVYDKPEEFLESDGEIIVLKVVPGADGEDDLVSLDDEDEFNNVWEEFEKLLEEEYELEQ